MMGYNMNSRKLLSFAGLVFYSVMCFVSLSLECNIKSRKFPCFINIHVRIPKNWKIPSLKLPENYGKFIISGGVTFSKRGFIDIDTEKGNIGSFLYFGTRY